MFKYTIAAACKIIDDLKKIFFGIQIVFQLFLVAYPLCMLILDFGVRIKNVILVIVAFAYFVFLLLTKGKTSKEIKNQKKAVNIIIDVLKITADFFAIFVLVDGIIAAQDNSAIFSYISLAIIAVTWIAKLVGYWVVKFVSKELELIIDGFERDTYVFQYAKSKVNHFVHSVIGDAKTEEPEPIISEENIKILDKALDARERRKAYKKSQTATTRKAFFLGLYHKAIAGIKKTREPATSVEIPTSAETPAPQIEAPKKKNPLTFLIGKKKKSAQQLAMSQEECAEEEAIPKA